MSDQDFTRKIFEYLKPGNHVLDLGAGVGDFARMFVEHGAKVTAVDPIVMTQPDPNIKTKPMRIEDFYNEHNSDQYDLIFARNILQFLDKNWVFATLFPWLEGHLTPNGIIAIETFYQNPNPPFDQPMRSLYTLQELTAHFMSWSEIFAREYNHQGLDMSGQSRQFFISSLIVRRPV